MMMGGESLSFAGEAQNHVVSLLALCSIKTALIVCAATWKTVGDVFGLCAGQQIGVSLAKELRISIPPLLYLYMQIFFGKCSPEN